MVGTPSSGASLRRTLDLFPDTAHVDDRQRLWIGGCLASRLARQFGTPLYLFDGVTLRSACRGYTRALEELYPGRSEVAYAAKAYLNQALAQLLAREQMNLDVVSGGELYVALAAGFPVERIHFHGNNKDRAELETALEVGVGRIVVDNLHELGMLGDLAAERQQTVRIWLRLAPEVDVHTHEYRRTGQRDSKFGLPMGEDRPSGSAQPDAERAVDRAMSHPYLELLGLHAHLGSQIVAPEPYADSMSRLLAFAARMEDTYGFHLQELSPGGGWGVPYSERDRIPPVKAYLRTLCRAVINGCRESGFPLPTLIVEPGRSIVARAAVALYRIGARKEIPGGRTYVSLDGGMADNIRPALYGTRHTAIVADRVAGPVPGTGQDLETVSLAGKYCESGDILIHDIELPRLEPGDLLAVPVVGAYGLALSSNYNLSRRPAVLMVNDGEADLIQRRESYADLVRRDLRLP